MLLLRGYVPQSIPMLVALEYWLISGSYPEYLVNVNILASVIYGCILVRFSFLRNLPEKS